MQNHFFSLFVFFVMGIAPSVFAQNAPQKHLGQKPPQFIVFSFDGSYNLPFWDETKHFARNRLSNNLAFTYFISGVYFVPDASRSIYRAPNIGAGRSDIGFGDDVESITQRIEQVRDAFQPQSNQSRMEIGSHANGHFDGNARGWGYEQWKSEFSQFHHFIEDFFSVFKVNNRNSEQWKSDIHEEIRGFRAPLLSYNKDTYKVMREFGYQYSASAQTPSSKPDQWPYFHEGVWEFPLMTLRMPYSKRFAPAMDYNFFAQQCDVDAKKYAATYCATSRAEMEKECSAGEKSQKCLLMSKAIGLVCNTSVQMVDVLYMPGRGFCGYGESGCKKMKVCSAKAYEIYWSQARANEREFTSSDYFQKFIANRFKDYEEEMYLAYMNGFEKVYNGNRAVMNIGHHFSPWNFGSYWRAMQRVALRFCNGKEFPEVRCVNHREVISFMKKNKELIQNLAETDAIPAIVSPLITVERNKIQIQRTDGKDFFLSVNEFYDRPALKSNRGSLSLEIQSGHPSKLSVFPVGLTNRSVDSYTIVHDQIEGKIKVVADEQRLKFETKGDLAEAHVGENSFGKDLLEMIRLPETE